MLRWRGAALLAVFLCALLAFRLGAGVTDRPGVPSAGVFTQAYYALGLFVLGGLDLGMPVGGSDVSRGILWATYFAAPAITASALTEAVLRALRPQYWALRRMEGHIVFAGCGKVTMQALEKLRARGLQKPVVIVEHRPDHPSLDEAQGIYDALVVIGDIASDALLESLRLDHADRFLALTGDDFVNLDATAKALGLAPNLKGGLIAHVSDLHFLRVVADSALSQDITIFNTHQVAAEHLVKDHLLQHFDATAPLDIVVIAGFGRFGQTVLDELQKNALGGFDRVVILDVQCSRNGRAFEDEVGYRGDYERELHDGDISDPDLWLELAERLDFANTEPAFVIGAGDDETNLRMALWLKRRFPKSLVAARSFRRSVFAESIAADQDIAYFNVADLVADSLPDHWLG
ncbi:MAG: NAD-binding protein [Myxococcales bacterium]|nr:NAD-binding protein [Myxococcales bacterium]